MKAVEGLNRWSDWDGKCPDCGGEEFQRGPSGGLSVNIRCAKCLHEFNHMGLFGLERIKWVVPEDCMAVGPALDEPGLFSRFVGWTGGWSGRRK